MFYSGQWNQIKNYMYWKTLYVYMCVCVCVRLFLPETEDTNQRINIKSRTTPQPWTVLDPLD